MSCSWVCLVPLWVAVVCSSLSSQVRSGLELLLLLLNLARAVRPDEVYMNLNSWVRSVAANCPP